MVKVFISALLGLASIQGAIAAPKVYPEVIPGPGLPSLASLNVTSAQLYEMGIPEGKDKTKSPAVAYTIANRAICRAE
jgi:hypothetical protein